MWEEDPRPIRKGFKATWWNPQDYKDENPYGTFDPEFLEEVDDLRRIDNKTLIYCDRFPKRVTVHRDHQCGEFIEFAFKKI